MDAVVQVIDRRYSSYIERALGYKAHINFDRINLQGLGEAVNSLESLLGRRAIILNQLKTTESAIRASEEPAKRLYDRYASARAELESLVGQLPQTYRNVYGESTAAHTARIVKLAAIIDDLVEGRRTYKRAARLKAEPAGINLIKDPDEQIHGLLIQIVICMGLQPYKPTLKSPKEVYITTFVSKVEQGLSTDPEYGEILRELNGALKDISVSNGKAANGALYYLAKQLIHLSRLDELVHLSKLDTVQIAIMPKNKRLLAQIQKAANSMLGDIGVNTSGYLGLIGAQKFDPELISLMVASAKGAIAVLNNQTWGP